MKTKIWMIHLVLVLVMANTGCFCFRDRTKIILPGYGLTMQLPDGWVVDCWKNDLKNYRFYNKKDEIHDTGSITVRHLNEGSLSDYIAGLSSKWTALVVTDRKDNRTKDFEVIVLNCEGTQIPLHMIIGFVGIGNEVLFIQFCLEASDVEKNKQAVFQAFDTIALTTPDQK
jgi:hypothetical protein